jgi:putative redox protein
MGKSQMTTLKIVNASASWTDGERFVAMASSGHALIVDSDRQRNSGVGPMELVLIGLCACTATDIVSILTKKREPFTSIEVRAEGQRANTPPMVYETIKLIYKVGGKVTRKAVEDAVRLSEGKYCSVSAMLQKTAKITSEIQLDTAANATRQ